MTYQFCLDSNATLHMTERHSHIKIAYYSKQQMDELYPDGGYEVIGEIGNFAKNSDKPDVIVTDTGKNIRIFPRGSFEKPFEWITGYAPIGKGIYVAVIKSIIPRLF